MKVNEFIQSTIGADIHSQLAQLGFTASHIQSIGVKDGLVHVVIRNGPTFHFLVRAVWVNEPKNMWKGGK
jgi:hypothetical protein